MRALVPLACLLGALALAAPAGAAERVATFPVYGRDAFAGVMPIGSDVGYGHRLASGAFRIGTTTRTVAVLPRAAAGQIVGARIAASPNRFAWTRTVDTIRLQRIPDPLLEDRLFSEQPPGAPAQVDDCPPTVSCRVSVSAFQFAVDGAKLVWYRRSWPVGPLTIDPGDGRPPRQVELAGDPDVVSQVAAAGGRVAYSTSEWERDTGTVQRVVVLDEDDREVLRVESQSGGAWALQPDGRLVIWSGEGGPGWYSPEEPYRHPIPSTDAVPTGIVGAADDRIAYRAGTWRMTLLRVAALDGQARTVALLPFDSLRAAGFDGTTLAWAAQRCGVIGIWTAPADGTSPPWQPATGPCPEFAVRPPQLGRERIVSRLECPAGCRGTVTLVERDRPWRELARRRVAFGKSTRDRIVRLNAGRATANALRRHPKVLLQRFSGRDRTGEPVAAERTRSARPVGR